MSTIPTPADVAPKVPTHEGAPSVTTNPEPAAATPGAVQELPADHPLVKALAAQKDEIKGLRGKAARLAEIEEANKTAEQKTAEALAAAQAEAAQSSAKALRYEVAAAKGLDMALAARLTGSTKEELEADADALKALIPKAPEAPQPPAGPTVPGQQSGGQQPALVTQSDLDALAASGKYDEINRLRREGRLSHLGVAPPKKR
jgi:hypothetical protein